MKRIFTISGFILLCFFFVNTAFAQNFTVKGKVTDASTGEVLPGVSVIIKGTSNGTQTDVNGAFSLSVTPNSTLQISFVGYTSQEVAVSKGAPIVVKLVSADNELQQVVVVGYGTQRKVDVTGAISTVKGSDLASQPDANPVSALQGKVAGVQIINSGTPGSSPQITLRGIGTIFGNTAPLFVVDGVWYRDISFLNSNDIETMSVLKDASSEAIYGLQASNGVIIITTKKGKGAAKVRYDGYVGYSNPTNVPVMANATQYATMVNEVNGSLTGSPLTFKDPASFGTGTDWLHLILHSAFTQNHDIGISGSTDKSDYNFSAGYFQQNGNVSYNTYDRITMHMAQNVQVSKILKFGYSAILEGDHSKDLPGNILYKAYTAAPVVPVRYADGTYGDPGDFPVGNAVSNPQVSLDYFNQTTQNYLFNGNAYGELKFTKDLSFRSSFGGTFSHQEVQNYDPVYDATASQFNNISELSRNNSDQRNWILENTLTYDKSIGSDNHITILAGQSAQRLKNYSESASAQNVPDYTSGDLYFNLGNNPTLSDAGDLETRESYFGRINYAYKDKYLLNATIRRDGTSVYSEQYKWGTFPSIGAGWVISNEDFMKDQTIFDNLKLRASWGKAGNGSIVPNLATQTDQQFISNLGGGDNLQIGEGLTSLTPPIIYYEKTVGTDIGLESAFLKNRLTFEVDYYEKKTEDAVFPVPILGSLGASGGTLDANQATYVNKGWEFTAGWNDHIGSDFSYSINGNFSINNNKVTQVLSGDIPLYGGGAGASGGAFTNRTMVGQPIGEFYGYQVVGIFQTPAQVAAAKATQPNAQVGDVIYGNNAQKTDLGNPNPKFLYGLNTKFKYKQFDLGIDLSGVGKVSLYNANEGIRYGYENWTEDFYNSRWHGAGTSNTTPSAFLSDAVNGQPNSFYVESGSYLRIRNLQLGYDLPVSLAQKLKMSNLHIYVSAQNLATFTKYKGFNPEVEAITTGGVQAGINQGIDTGVTPIYAIFNLGVNVTF
ncbi:SusC/RagA family TonB-linked outer membrane protein [Mucilaginibacter sp. E4BP6]|uniref:SusC/RagA family TonB-linked outer membrane protein n=1 Tax=Mucilaginibacter sp. E4BP6 TaxID=2723089 RepID=UPI0015C90339|nr:TonB-dependent receptor [Mucilaginibacter sp. E4BP6]NYE67392.1 TonB-linked SusC/RagA family outer membrane protein [Mucilaginibacter sp. E4BP6]